ncbi:MAG: hypothetical protein Q7K65_00695 [Candidatus Buchananbacteria bacterium]|nr:hypothetical protein [Candidatus Buchananbacteria bacterium]
MTKLISVIAVFCFISIIFLGCPPPATLVVTAQLENQNGQELFSDTLENYDNIIIPSNTGPVFGSVRYDGVPMSKVQATFSIDGLSEAISVSVYNNADGHKNISLANDEDGLYKTYEPEDLWGYLIALGIIASIDDLHLSGGVENGVAFNTFDFYMSGSVKSLIVTATANNGTGFATSFTREGGEFFDLNITTQGQGTTTGAGTYPAGTDVIITATPENGWSFDHWIVNGTLAYNNPGTITMDSDVSVTAVFTSNGNPGGPISVDLTWDGSVLNFSATGANPGVIGLELYHQTGGNPWIERQTFAVTSGNASGTVNKFRPNILRFGVVSSAVSGGYVPFESASVRINGINVPLVNVDGNTAYQVDVSNIIQQPTNHVLSITVQGQGTVTGAGSYAAGTQVTISATAATGWTFSKWIVNGTDAFNNPGMVTMDSDVSVTAVFASESNPGGLININLTWNGSVLNFSATGGNPGVIGLELYHQTGGNPWIERQTFAVTSGNASGTVSKFRPNILRFGVVSDATSGGYIPLELMTVKINGQTVTLVDGAFQVDVSTTL